MTDALEVQQILPLINYPLMSLKKRYTGEDNPRCTILQKEQKSWWPQLECLLSKNCSMKVGLELSSNNNDSHNFL